MQSDQGLKDSCFQTHESLPTIEASFKRDQACSSCTLPARPASTAIQSRSCQEAGFDQTSAASAVSTWPRDTDQKNEQHNGDLPCWSCRRTRYPSHHQLFPQQLCSENTRNPRDTCPHAAAGQREQWYVHHATPEVGFRRTKIKSHFPPSTCRL